MNRYIGIDGGGTKTAAVLCAALTAVFGATLAVCAAEASAQMPSPQLLRRIKEGPEIISIVHWGPNTYTDREWGFGDEAPESVNPAKFDADQIVGACKAGGIGGIILVCKHHDGFCLWPTKTTEHNISRSPFRGGRGDCVREVEQACRRAGLKFGVYVSPWDRNNAKYGFPEYVETYHEQFRELCGGAYGEIFEAWFDGANGGDGWYGGAKERRTIPKDYYRFDELHEWLRKRQPSITFMGTKAKARDFNWPGNERGVIPENASNSSDGRFRMFEADFPLRQGWFYHERNKGRTKSGLQLARIYFTSVGRGGTMNIGGALDKDGLVCEEDVRKLKDFKRIIDALFAHEAAPGEPFNIVELREDLSRGENVKDWELLADDRLIASGRYVGAKRLVTFKSPVSPCRLAVNVPDVSVRRFLAPQRLLSEVIGAAGAKETDTAKRMHKGAQDGQ